MDFFYCSHFHTQQHISLRAFSLNSNLNTITWQVCQAVYLLFVLKFLKLDHIEIITTTNNAPMGSFRMVTLKTDAIISAKASRNWNGGSCDIYT